jgi:Large ribosomal RNA subunit accumulation protein YceD
MPLKQPDKTSLQPSEWFYPFHVENVPPAGRTVKMRAEPQHMQGIAKRLDVPSVNFVEAELHLSLQNAGHILYITGHIKAEIVQECVVTLKPLTSIVEDSFEAWYADHDKAVSFNRAKHQLKALEEADEVPILEEQDDPEPLIDSQVDLGEVVIQFLSLAVNPYPRDGSLEESEEPDVKVISEKSSILRPNPFAALKNWRPKD